MPAEAGLKCVWNPLAYNLSGRGTPILELNVAYQSLSQKVELTRLEREFRASAVHVLFAGNLVRNVAVAD